MSACFQTSKKEQTSGDPSLKNKSPLLQGALTKLSHDFHLTGIHLKDFHSLDFHATSAVFYKTYVLQDQVQQDQVQQEH